MRRLPIIDPATKHTVGEATVTPTLTGGYTIRLTFTDPDLNRRLLNGPPFAVTISPFDITAVSTVVDRRTPLNDLGA